MHRESLLIIQGSFRKQQIFEYIDSKMGKQYISFIIKMEHGWVLKWTKWWQSDLHEKKKNFKENNAS